MTIEIKACFYNTAIGRVGIAGSAENITNVLFGKTVVPAEYRLEETPLLREAASQLRAYLAGERAAFTLPLLAKGTAFEQTVWNALRTIPFGEVRSYAQIAAQIGKPGACRAVGRANGRNPISIFIPCHRVIGSNGALTGYAGGLELKQRLLLLEQGTAPLTKTATLP